MATGSAQPKRKRYKVEDEGQDFRRALRLSQPSTSQLVPLVEEPLFGGTRRAQGGNYFPSVPTFGLVCGG